VIKIVTKINSWRKRKKGNIGNQNSVDVKRKVSKILKDKGEIENELNCQFIRIKDYK